MSMEQNKGNIPFKDLSLERKKGFFSVMKELPESHGKIVKEVKTSTDNPLEEWLKAIEPTKDYLRIATQTPQISQFIPQTDFVVGHNQSGNKTIYIVQDKIENCEVSQEELEKRKEMLVTLIKSILKIYFNTYQKGSGKIIEIEKAENFLWGKNLQRENAVAQLWAIDFVPVHERPPFAVIRVLKEFCDIYHVQLDTFHNEISLLEKLN